MPINTNAPNARPARRRNAPAAASDEPARFPWTSAAVFVVFASLYWAMGTHYNTFDAVSYANQIGRLYPSTGDRHYLFHPHHVLFNATGYALWRCAQSLGYTGGPLVVLERYNAIVAALGIAVFHATLRSLMQRSRWLPALIATGLAVTFGYWVCATDGRVNATSTTLLLGSFGALCALRDRAATARALLAGALAGMAVLYHESAGLFVVVGLTAVALLPDTPLPQGGAGPDPNPLPGKEREPDGATLTQRAKPTRLRMACAFLASWAAVAGVGYLIVGGLVLGLHSPRAFHAWSAEYSELGWWWNFDIPNNLHSDIVALRRAAFVQPPGSHGTLHLSANTPTGLLALYVATLIGWFVAVYYFCVALPLLWRTHHRPILITSMAWIALYAGFFTVWSPGEYIFWVPALVPISLLLALTMAHFRSQRAGVLVNWLVGAWIVMYGCVNLVVDIGPHLQPLANPCERIALEYRAHTRPGDLVLLAGAGDLARLEVDIPYFGNRDCRSLHTTLARAHNNVDIATQRLQRDIGETISTGHAVYVCDDLWHAAQHPDVTRDIERHHPGVEIGQIAGIFQPWHGDRAWTSSHGPVWRLEPPS